MAPPKPEVVIAGAGPVGLALAMELAWRGVPSALVDPGEDRRGRPRAKLTNVRSMEHLRRWGLAGRVRAAAPLPPGYSSDILFVTRLTGALITRFTDVFASSPGRRDEFPERAQQIPQYALEDVLREAAIGSGLVTVIRDRITGFEEAADFVKVGLAGSTPLTAAYLAGCDGGASTVRRAMGARMLGDHALTQNLGIVFSSAELHRRNPHGPALHYWLVNSDAPGFMGPIDDHELWWLIRTAIPRDVDATSIDALDLVHRAAGCKVAAEVHLLDPWQAHRLTAERIATGRVFLAGDAAHLHPPFGAHGMNAGIGDAVDLGWKLAASVEGWAGEGLLASYVAERAPLHRRVVDEAALNNERLAHLFVTPGLEHDPGARSRAAAAIQEAKLREFRSLGLVLGHSFDSSPLVVPDGTPAVESPVTEYHPSSRPGSLLPHAWMPDGSSLYDHLGAWFTLVEDGRDPAVVNEFLAAAQGLRIPLAVVRHERSGLLLVRPDRIVAWRHSGALDGAAKVLRVAAGHELAAGGGR